MWKKLAVGVVVGLVAASAPSGVAVATDEGSAAAPTVDVRTIKPGRLKRGPDARLDHVQDGVLRRADGRTVRIRVPSTHGRLALVGTSGRWRLVASAKGEYVRVWKVRPGRKPVLVKRSRTQFTPGYSFYGVRASRDGRWLLGTTYDRGGSTTVVREVATGRRVASRYSSAFFMPFDADAGHVLTYMDSADELPVVDWQPGTGRRSVADVAVAGFLRRDLVFVGAGTSGRVFGPTSVAAPGTPPWSARFAPLDVSPDGSLVLGTSTGPKVDRRRVLELRSMADGTLLQAFTYGSKEGQWSITLNYEQTARFESDDHFVFQVDAGKRKVLVRCSTAAGRCKRASAYGGNVSFAYERFMW